MLQVEFPNKRENGVGTARTFGEKNNVGSASPTLPQDDANRVKDVNARREKVRSRYYHKSPGDRGNMKN